MRLPINTSLVLLLILVNYTSALNILSIILYQGRSHFIVYKELLQELARRGHNVTVISHFPEANPPKNYHDISLAGSTPIYQDIIPLEEIGLQTHFFMAYYLTQTGKENCDLALANKQVINFVKSKPKFDVVLTELFNNDCALGIAYKLEAPVVAVTSFILMPWHYDRFGIPTNPAFVSFHFMGGGTRPTLFQKVKIAIANQFYRLCYYYRSQKENQASLEEKFGEIPQLEDLGRDIKFLLLYTHFTLTRPVLLPPNVIEVGGYHIPKAKPLTGELKKFVDDADVGIILISFGSMAKVSTMTQEQLEAVLETIAAFPHRFIWRWDDPSMDKPPISTLPKHLRAILNDKTKLYTSNWLPQIDILGHPKVAAFFSHGGMGGSSEALNFGVPVVVMPIIGDQQANAASVVESGLGVKIELNELKKENIVAALKTVLEPTFSNRVKQLSNAWHDRPLSSMDTAIYWIEYAARNKNFTFRSPAADLPLYKFYNLDVIGVFSGVFIFIFLIIKAATKVCYCCCKNRKPINVQSTKKKQKKH